MNRHDRRAQAAQKPTVSVALLQRQLRESEAEREQAKLMLLALVKLQGRVRVPKELLAGIDPRGDSVEARDVGDSIVFEFRATNMVAGTAGVTNGRPNEAG